MVKGKRTFFDFFADAGERVIFREKQKSLGEYPEGENLAEILSIKDAAVIVEHRDESFAATINPFAITVYGYTADEAEKRAWDGFSLLLRQNASTLETLKNYLDNLNIRYDVRDAVAGDSYTSHITRECRGEISVRVGKNAWITRKAK